MHRARRVRSYTTGMVVCFLCLVAAGLGRAEPVFFEGGCASCHASSGPTCDGCHNHKGNLSAVADRTSYSPGQAVVVTLDGGTEHGWFRALLYDHNDAEIRRVNFATFPAPLSATAPAVVGDYVWNAAWYGNNDGLGHVERRASVTIHVALNPADVQDDQPRARLSTWGRLKSFFRR